MYLLKIIQTHHPQSEHTPDSLQAQRSCIFSLDQTIDINRNPCPNDRNRNVFNDALSNNIKTCL